MAEFYSLPTWSLFWFIVAVAFLYALPRMRDPGVVVLLVALIAPIVLYLSLYLFSSWPNYFDHVGLSMQPPAYAGRALGFLLIVLAISRRPEKHPQQAKCLIVPLARSHVPSERPWLSSPEETALARDPEIVREMFDRVARRYDLANHLLSFGCDFYWRRRAAEIVAGWNPACVLDLATGSGDLARVIQRKLSTIQVVGLDFSNAMLALARRKGVRNLIAADAVQLPLANQSFDVVTIAFGLRNIHDWGGALRGNAARPTSAGHLLVLDFSLPQHPIWRSLHRFYLHRIMPFASALITV